MLSVAVSLYVDVGRDGSGGGNDVAVARALPPEAPRAMSNMLCEACRTGLKTRRTNEGARYLDRLRHIFFWRCVPHRSIKRSSVEENYAPK